MAAGNKFQARWKLDLYAWCRKHIKVTQNCLFNCALAFDAAAAVISLLSDTQCTYMCPLRSLFFFNYLSAYFISGCFFFVCFLLFGVLCVGIQQEKAIWLHTHTLIGKTQRFLAPISLGRSVFLSLAKAIIYTWHHSNRCRCCVSMNDDRSFFIVSHNFPLFFPLLFYRNQFFFFKYAFVHKTTQLAHIHTETHQFLLIKTKDRFSFNLCVWIIYLYDGCCVSLTGYHNQRSSSSSSSP